MPVYHSTVGAQPAIVTVGDDGSVAVSVKMKGYDKANGLKERLESFGLNAELQPVALAYTGEDLPNRKFAFKREGGTTFETVTDDEQVIAVDQKVDPRSLTRFDDALTALESIRAPELAELQAKIPAAREALGIRGKANALAR